MITINCFSKFIKNLCVHPQTRFSFFFIGMCLLLEPLQAMDFQNKEGSSHASNKRKAEDYDLAPPAKRLHGPSLDHGFPIGSPDHLLACINQAYLIKGISRADREKIEKSSAKTVHKNTIESRKKSEAAKKYLEDAVAHCPPHLPPDTTINESRIFAPKPQIIKGNNTPRVCKHKRSFLKATGGQNPKQHMRKFNYSTKESVQILHFLSYGNHGPYADQASCNLGLGSQGTNHAMRARDEQRPKGFIDAPRARVIKGSLIIQKIRQILLNPFTKQIVDLSEPMDGFMSMKQGKEVYKKSKADSDPVLLQPIFMFQQMSKIAGNEDTWKKLEDLTFDEPENDQEDPS